MEGENNRNEKNGGGNRQRFHNRPQRFRNDKRGEKREQNEGQRNQNRENRRPQRPPRQNVNRGEPTAEEIAAETKSIEAEIKMEIEELKALKSKFGI